MPGSTRPRHLPNAAAGRLQQARSFLATHHLIAQSLYGSRDRGRGPGAGHLSGRIPRVSKAQRGIFIERTERITFRQTACTNQRRRGTPTNIRPIALGRLRASRQAAQNHFRLYQLIYDRFLASQMAEAVYDSLVVTYSAALHLQVQRRDADFKIYYSLRRVQEADPGKKEEGERTPGCPTSRKRSTEID